MTLLYLCCWHTVLYAGTVLGSFGHHCGLKLSAQYILGMFIRYKISRSLNKSWRAHTNGQIFNKTHAATCNFGAASTLCFILWWLIEELAVYTSCLQLTCILSLRLLYMYCTLSTACFLLYKWPYCTGTVYLQYSAWPQFILLYRTFSLVSISPSNKSWFRETILCATEHLVQPLHPSVKQVGLESRTFSKTLQVSCPRLSCINFAPR